MISCLGNNNYRLRIIAQMQLVLSMEAILGPREESTLLSFVASAAFGGALLRKLFECRLEKK